MGQRLVVMCRVGALVLGGPAVCDHIVCFTNQRAYLQGLTNAANVVDCRYSESGRRFKQHVICTLRSSSTLLLREFRNLKANTSLSSLTMRLVSCRRPSTTSATFSLACLTHNLPSPFTTKPVVPSHY
ncbi:hypothetical protein F4604DRAFT_1756125 [Suillus subluteus]|nr:hypothetical protein F4604DRAFT_1756125 [Suillus subluteus]